MRPGQDERIAHLFRRGHSLDLVSELGLLYGWTREEAKAVVAAQGWSLDWSGRLQLQHLKGSVGAWPTVANAEAERLLNVGIDHEVPEIRKVAMTAERAVERLRAALLNNEQSGAIGAMQALQEALGGHPGPRGPERTVRAS